MADRIITNCHIHLFTLDHVPRDYPIPAAGFFRDSPALINTARFISRINPDFKEQLDRLARMREAGAKGSQAQVLNDLRNLYPEDTRFVILPMDIGAPAGYREPEKTIHDQHDKLAELAALDAFKDVLIPFATIHPDRENALDEVKRCVEELGFRGLKLYPRLGYRPDHPVLLQIYEYLSTLGRPFPIMTHCSTGGVYAKNKRGKTGINLGHPRNYPDVLKSFPKLNFCLAHFGGNDMWEAYRKTGVHPDDPTGREENWVTAILDLISSGDHPNLYTDISYTLFDFDENIPALSAFLTDPLVREKVLFGSDYYMTKQTDLSEREVSMKLRMDLGEDLFWQIAETNPKAWLGSD